VSVCMSDISQCSIKMAKGVITRTMPHNSQFSEAKDLPQIQLGSYPIGVTNTSKAGKNINFQQITCYISKMVQDRCTVSMKGNKKSYVLHQMLTTLSMTLNDPNHLKSPYFLRFWVLLHISGTDKIASHQILYTGRPYQVLDLQ